MTTRSAYRERRSRVLPATVWESASTGGESVILPDGCMDIIWDGAHFIVAGPDTMPYRYRSEGPRRMTAVRFDPGIAPSLLRTGADELRETRLGLEDVWPLGTVRGWGAAMRDSADPVQTLEALAAAACNREPPPGWVAPAAGLLGAGLPVSQVASRVGFSTRQLQRCSVRHFGYGPKMLQRILRVRAATEAVGVGAALSDAAAAHGYADYAHFHRESHALLGRSPSTFAPRRNVTPA